MDMTRRQLLRVGAVTAGALTVAGPVLRAGQAQASGLAWLVPRFGTYSSLIDTSLGGSSQVAASAFNQGTTWFSVGYEGAGPSTKNPVPAGYSGVAVLKFEAYQNGSTGLIDAIGAGLPSWVQAVQYDSESWSQTPALEQGAWL
jgi:TAT (twin-arginine translocation) pathway signal sequence